MEWEDSGREKSLGTACRGQMLLGFVGSVDDILATGCH